MADNGNIQILPPQEARRIAAGEVIDRPAALIREFLDNAIDAGAANIEVSVEGGGVTLAEVADDGCGMARGDLEKCWLAHATSKIRSLDDLSTAETLGFRGEALAAAAAVTRLEIVSSTGAEAWRLEVGPGDACPPYLEQTSRTKGSTVRARSLYDTIPARKRFLKREGSEAAQCRQAFIEKALAYPWIHFRFSRDGKPGDIFPAAASKKERFAAALLDRQEWPFLHEIHIQGEGFSADIVIGGPELSRPDRRMMYIFANGRRIQDYSLLLALEYGTQGWFPNGVHPIGAVYIDIDPALADFNIHPAKREARFRDPGAIHHAVTAGLRDFCKRVNIKLGTGDWGLGTREIGGKSPPPLQPASWLPLPPSAGALNLCARTGEGVIVSERYSVGPELFHTQKKALVPAPATPPSIAPYSPVPSPLSPNNPYSPVPSPQSLVPFQTAAEEAPAYGEIRFAGRAFGVFILVERGDRLYIIDQHAAHERILYNAFLAGPIPKQELLVPITFNAECAEDDRFLEAKREELTALAVDIERDGNGWRIDALPSDWRLGDGETVREILGLRTARENIAERWAATLCCHRAIRDGDYLDDDASLALAREAFALSDPRCPHGRPIWTEISREALNKAVRRTEA